MIVKLVARSALAIVLLLSVLAHTSQAATHQTVPSANFSFIPDLQTFLRSEDASRHADLYPNAVVSGGIHSTAAGLTGSPSALLAYLAGTYTTETGTITYPNTSVCWVIAHPDTTGNVGSFTRVSGTHYLLNCGSIPQPTLPTLPSMASVYLMKVTTTGGAITEVIDLRPWGGQTGFDLCKYASLTDAMTALGNRPAHLLLNCHLPVAQNVSLPSTVTVWPSRNGAFAVESGVTITAVSPRQFPLTVDWQIFEGASTAPVAFTNPGAVRPELWGGGPGVAAATNTTAINAAITAQPSGSLTASILFTHGTYSHDNSLSTNSRNICLVGEGRHSTILSLSTVASVRHAYKVTGTTQYQCAKGLTFMTATALTTDSGMNAIRMDADAGGDAPSLTANAEQYLDDVGCIGYNICRYADGGSSFKIRLVLTTNAYFSLGGSGLTSGVNEGEVCQRVIKCDGDHVYIDGNQVMDHGIYDLTALSSHRTNYLITGSLNESVKMIPTSGVPSLTDPYHWSFTDSTILNTQNDSTNAFLIAADQDYTIDKIDLSNNRISNCGAGGSHSACVMIVASNTGVIRNLDLHGMTINGAYNAVFNLTVNDTASINFINATDLWLYDWSTETDDTYSVFSPNVAVGGTLGTLVYSGYFNGATHGRSIFTPSARASFTFVQALAVTELNTSVPEGHPLVTKMGTSTATLKLAGNLNCQTFNASGAITGANTTETDLATYTMPAGAMSNSVSGVNNTSGVHVYAWGTTAANGNTKTIRLKFDGTTLKSNSVTTAPNGADWLIDLHLHRYDATNQTGIVKMWVSTNDQGTNVLSPTATLANAIIIKVTGQNGTSSSGDISLRGFCVDGFPN